MSFDACRLCSILALAAALVFGAAGGSLLAQTPPSATAEPRTVLPLADGWRFRFGDPDDAPSRENFDDGAWETVALPHTWNRVGEYRLARTAATDARRGTGWYRLRLDAPPSSYGARTYLDFAAVATVADVFVNGVHVGRHRGAFSRFRIDVTSVWRPGEENLVAVKADNAAPAIGSGTEHVIPLSGDFFVHGGIYRGVSLVTRDAAGIDLMDSGGPGVYARAAAVSAESAEVEVTTRLRNDGSEARAIQLVTTIRDADGRQVAQGSRAMALQRGAAEAREQLTVNAPRLWDGRRDPYLYSVTVEARDGDRVIDRVTQPLGLRSFRFDADAGFFLNGRREKLRGASRHQDRLGKGWALSAADNAQDMDVFVEIGANAVRQAHYQHADEWSDEADRRGMIVWAEIPYVNLSSLAGGQGSEALWENAVAQLRELIRQNYNHPSIAMWSIGNEVDSVTEAAATGEPRRSAPLLRRLAEAAKAEDPYRPSVFADCCESRPGGEALAGIADLIGYNRYHGWYYTAPANARAAFGAELDRLHARHPGLPISVSEYGAGGAPSQHRDDVLAVLPNVAGRPQPEEFQSYIHEQSWPVVRDRDFVFGAWIWNMFDFAAPREEGDSVDLNTKGLVTADRSTRKDAFYFYKAHRNPEPMIHLTGKRHARRAYATVELKAYSNADTATLTLNGAAVGEVACPERICLWRDVTLSPGRNEAVVSARADGVEVSDRAVLVAPSPSRDGPASP
ncbi:glycoside hydrolase family 2 [Methylopila sp. M107]|uniref:glycoside hydrolase family 2 protein n=1 Tax=Methylopila sp. M107 TaxID=1101190 RepID=UPI00038143CF|nr:glycoside hydrolase family 2 [Methylopila sp. M107]